MIGAAWCSKYVVTVNKFLEFCDGEKRANAIAAATVALAQSSNSRLEISEWTDERTGSFSIVLLYLIFWLQSSSASVNPRLLLKFSALLIHWRSTHLVVRRLPRAKVRQTTVVKLPYTAPHQ
ncbi:hypothetical protein L596_013238 [Steinernema carpocapsae]|uniref:Uncharacterized protein n=1 Tax=Steinernema carpocapsae TaxID=34508 RepID=A0A4U5NZQ4_STECR|nr:hypothetical protein L596_013238 [Steinernema carpocapsae]